MTTMKKKYSTNPVNAKKSLGQNFLVNRGILDKVLGAAQLDKNDIVIEIGPGTGILTKKLSDQAGRVIAVEKDSRLIEGLKEKFKNTNVEVVEDDILNFNPTKYKILDTGYKILGNIPYYITSHLLKTIFDPAGSKNTADRHSEKGRASNGARKWPTPELIVLMVQKEVAQRIMAKPPHMNLLALSVQFFAESKIISYVSRGSFRPIPKVDSAIIRLTPKRESRIKNHELGERFFRLTRTAFAGKRKQLKNTLGKEILEKAGIRPESRPEELSLEDWLKMSMYHKMEI